MTTLPEGELIVRLDCTGRRVRRASVRSTRPLAVPRLLVGREPREAAALLPLLFGVCGFAQGAAGAAALERAQGRDAAAGARAARTLAVALEALQEDLRRLAIDVPQALDGSPPIEAVAQARRAIAPLLAAAKPALAVGAEVDAPQARAAVDDLRRIVATSVLGASPEAFLALPDAPALLAWAMVGATAPARALARVLAEAPRLGASDVATMPDPTPDALARAVLAALDADPAFARAPHWLGTPVETGAQARCAAHPALAAFVAMHGNGVAARIVARLVEVARTLAAPGGAHAPSRVSAWSRCAGEGAAAVHTARGLLLHRARVADGRVASYAIVAPTEWNCHPDGALVRGLAGLAGDDARLARDAGLVVRTLDPCVAFRVEVAHA